MERERLTRLHRFYVKELRENLLPFWLPRCVDEVHGGFLNGFTNTGGELVHRDKYIWSQGRFTWLWAKLACMEGDIFSPDEKAHFGSLAAHGIRFLKNHGLANTPDLRCVYLTDEHGRAKLPQNARRLDASIYADCFVAAAFAKYAQMTGSAEEWGLAKALYQSILARIENGDFETLPYPLPADYRAHGIPMILNNLACTLYEAAGRLDPAFRPALADRMAASTEDVLENFTDPQGRLREIIRADGTRMDAGLFGTHINPGHTLEDAWFMLDAAAVLQRPGWLPQIARVAENALQLGWDDEYDGLFHYAALTGGPLAGDGGSHGDQPVLQYALQNSPGKIWWVHSEALYATLRLHLETGQDTFALWYDRLHSYVFRHFPNPDREVKEWVQTLDRTGQPRKTQVGLPVKDPYHIMRNVALMIELLEQPHMAGA